MKSAAVDANYDPRVQEKSVNLFKGLDVFVPRTISTDLCTEMMESYFEFAIFS